MYHIYDCTKGVAGQKIGPGFKSDEEARANIRLLPPGCCIYDIRSDVEQQEILHREVNGGTIQPTKSKDHSWDQKLLTTK